MPHVILSPNARNDLEYRRQFLARYNPRVAARAAHMIKKHLALLAVRPQLGRPSMKYPELRELLIAFGRSGYVALYRHDTQHNRIIVLSLRHQREA